MKTRQATILAILVSFALPGLAHRLDEYLQATMISIDKDRVQGSLRLVPGVAVLPTVLAQIDANQDGSISEAEGMTYAQQVLDHVSLRLDDRTLHAHLLSVKVPPMNELRQGVGEITIQWSGVLPAGGTHHRLVLQNKNQSGKTAFLANCLVPREPGIRILAQHRNRDQSLYELEYASESGAVRSDWWSGMHSSFGYLGGFGSMFRLGMRHIGEGTDHLLFLLALLLPAPLLAIGSRWGAHSGVRNSFIHIVRVVSAFTIGHSITLAFAGFGLVRVPSRPIEILIAFSILVSAAHALRPLFPGRESWIAVLFGLLHGLAFATTLDHLGLHWWERLVSILGFNLGIETMQLVVIAAVMPSLVLLSCTPAYKPGRVGGALFAMLASAGWLMERVLNIQTSTDTLVNGIAHHAFLAAASLLLISVVCWALHARSATSDSILRAPDPVTRGKVEDLFSGRLTEISSE